MPMNRDLRRFVLSAHIASSVGWLGAVAAFLALAVAGLTSGDAQMARAAYSAMELIGGLVVLPLSALSLGTGLVLSMGTKWGLIRHYWVLAKLVVNVAAIVMLSLYMPTLGALADSAQQTGPAVVDVSELRSLSPVLHAGAALLVLSAAVALSVYKPKGMTSYGRRHHVERRAVSGGRRSSD